MERIAETKPRPPWSRLLLFRPSGTGFDLVAADHFTLQEDTGHLVQGGFMCAQHAQATEQR
jgi:hypothetical protein